MHPQVIAGLVLFDTTVPNLTRQLRPDGRSRKDCHQQPP